MHAIHLNVPRVRALLMLAALLTAALVLAAAARLGDVSFGASSGGGGTRAPVTVTRSVASSAPRAAFLGNPFATPFRLTSASPLR